MTISHKKELEMRQGQLDQAKRELEVISIVGPIGIDKKTLANKINDDPLFRPHFDFIANIIFHSTSFSRMYTQFSSNLFDHLKK